MTTNTNRAGSITALIATLLFGSSCRKESTAYPLHDLDCPPGPTPVSSTTTTSEVQRDSVWVTDSIALSGPIAAIPEYHDCQQFIGEGGTYAGKYGIFARFRIGSVFGTLPAARGAAAIDSHTAERVVPTTLPTPAGGPPVPSRNVMSGFNEPFDASTPFQAAATIVAYGQAYAPLGLRPGVNCLYLAFVRERWIATVLHNGRSGNCAPNFVPRAPGNTELAVRSVIATGDMMPADIPEVARFDYDPGNRVYYIGLRCGDEWCEIGPKGFAPADPLSPVPSSMSSTPWTTANGKRVFALRGWYDRQQLAMVTPSGLTPTGPNGLIIPHPDLASWDSTDYKLPNGEWLDMAYIYVDSDAYQAKWGITRAAVGERPNTLQSRMRKKSWWEVTMPDWVWDARILDPTGSVVWEGKLRYNDHSAAMLAGFTPVYTARWRFIDNDEQAWVGCLAGCCTPKEN